MIIEPFRTQGAIPPTTLTELSLHAIQLLHLKQADAPPAIPGWRRILAKEFRHDDDGNQE